jgi:N-acetylglucosamine malate deacetylase 1
MKILAVGPHPDDVEFGCAPLLMQETRKGNEVKILVLSKGEAASSGTPEERAREARKAAEMIGAGIEFLALGGDCHFRPNPESTVLLAHHIRVFRPDIVLAPQLDENQHPDHAIVGAMVRDAARLARYGGLEELKGLAPHAIGHLYYYSITHVFGTEPDLVIDVTDVRPQWEEAMNCHQTQMKTRHYVELVLSRARALGVAIGGGYAVGLWVNDPVRIGSLSDLTLSSRQF